MDLIVSPEALSMVVEGYVVISLLFFFYKYQLS